jgi:hypothetical protein
MGKFCIYKGDDGVHLVVNKTDKRITNSPGTLSRFYNQLNLALGKVRTRQKSIIDIKPISTLIPNQDERGENYDFVVSINMACMNQSNLSEVTVVAAVFTTASEADGCFADSTVAIVDYREFLGYIKLIKTSIHDFYMRKEW